MNIAFDAKRITHNATGLGNYSRFVLGTLTEFLPENRYLLYSPSVGNPELYRQLLTHRSVRLFTPHRALALMGGSLWRNFSVPRHLRTQLLYRKKYGASARHADRVITVSEATRRDVIDIFGVEEERVTTVYQGCSEVFSRITPEETQASRGLFALPRRYILFVGSIEERKNLGLIVEALSLLQDKELHLVAVGRKTPYTQLVLERARRLGVLSRLHLLHGVSGGNLPGIYAGAEVFVYPSRFEGFGIPIIEALSAGVPVIGATGSCLEEAGGPSSLYTDPTDASMLATLIDRVVIDISLRKKMIEDGLHYVQRFTPKRIAKDLSAIYEEVLLTYE